MVKPTTPICKTTLIGNFIPSSGEKKLYLVSRDDQSVSCILIEPALTIGKH